MDEYPNIKEYVRKVQEMKARPDLVFIYFVDNNCGVAGKYTGKINLILQESNSDETNMREIDKAYDEFIKIINKSSTFYSSLKEELK